MERRIITIIRMIVIDVVVIVATFGGLKAFVYTNI